MSCSSQCFAPSFSVKNVVIEKIVALQLATYPYCNDLLQVFQSGFAKATAGYLWGNRYVTIFSLGIVCCRCSIRPQYLRCAVFHPVWSFWWSYGFLGSFLHDLSFSMVSPSLWSVGPLLLALQFEMASCGSAQCPATMLFAIVLFSQVELGMLLSR